MRDQSTDTRVIRRTRKRQNDIRYSSLIYTGDVKGKMKGWQIYIYDDLDSINSAGPWLRWFFSRVLFQQLLLELLYCRSAKNIQTGPFAPQLKFYATTCMWRLLYADSRMAEPCLVSCQQSWIIYHLIWRLNITINIILPRGGIM